MKKLISLLLLSATSALAQYTIGLSTQAYKGQDTGITFTPAAGAVSNPTTVTFSGAIAGSIYCSTQDGSTPATNLIGTACNNGTLGSTTSITSAVTVKVVSGLLGDVDSAVSSAAYTISGGSHSFSVVSGHTYSCAYTGTSNACSLGFTVGSGNGLLALCIESNGSTGTISLTPSGTPIATTARLSGTYQIWAEIVPSASASGISSVTITSSPTSGSSSCLFAEVTGLPTTTIAVDPSLNTVTVTGSTTTPSTGSNTTANAYDVVLGMVCRYAYESGQSFTAGTGYTAIGTSSYSSTSDLCFAEFYSGGSSGVAPAGTYNPSATYSGTAHAWGVATAGIELQ